MFLKELYDILDEFDFETDKWKECHEDEDDEIFEQFYFNAYWELYEWCANRTFDSGHLVGGPNIGCFRCGEKIKILWESTYKLDNGKSIWTSPKGSFEMFYDEFVLSVTEFFDSFFVAMDKQVENAVMKEWGSVLLDKKRLKDENDERKSRFSQQLSLLRNSGESTDWNKVMMLYSKMEDELKKRC